MDNKSFSQWQVVTITDPASAYVGRKASLVCESDWPNVWNVRFFEACGERLSSVFGCCNTRNMEAVAPDAV